MGLSRRSLQAFRAEAHAESGLPDIFLTLT